MQNNDCTKCGRRIANPVGESCRIKELNAWLKEQKIKPDQGTQIISESELAFVSNSKTGLPCVICHKHDVSLCTHCFFSHVRNVLVDHQVSNSILNKFEETFHYTLYDRAIVPKDIE